MSLIKLASKTTSRHSVLLACEDAAEFQALWDHFIEKYRPRGLHQSALVETMATVEWRTLRARKAEAAIFDIVMPLGKSLDLAETLRLMAENDCALNAITSRQNNLRRIWKSSYKALLAAQKDQAAEARAQRLN